jgi:hypothetical protein
MKHYFALVTTLLLLSTVFTAGCTKPTLPPTAPKAPITDYTKTPGINYATLVQKLREAGATVEFISDISRPEPIFPATGKSININGEPAQVYEFQDEATAQTEARKVWPDGSTIGPQPPAGKPGIIVSFNWIAPPHWYQSGKLIVVYLGENQAIMELLESLLGTQFAGM